MTSMAEARLSNKLLSIVTLGRPSSASNTPSKSAFSYRSQNVSCDIFWIVFVAIRAATRPGHLGKKVSFRSRFGKAIGF